MLRGFKFVLLLLSIHSIEGVLDVYIDQSIDKNICVDTSSQKTVCPSIEKFLEEFTNYSSAITIHVSRQVYIATVVVFHGISNLSVIGEVSKSKARLICQTGARTSACSSGKCIGLQFVKVKTLKIIDVEIDGCGEEHLLRNSILVWSALYINGCSDVIIMNVDIVSSFQTGLFIQDTSGNVSVVDVQVQNNILKEYVSKPKESFAGGMQIYFNKWTPKSQYEIINCHFNNNTTPKYKEFDPRHEEAAIDWIGFGLGGGVSIIFDENSTQHAISVINSTFYKNTAPWGGCMHVKFMPFCTRNLVLINNSNFEECTAHFGGGGIDIGMAQQMQNESVDNRVLITDVTFKNNTAEFGGGSYIYAFHGNQPARNKLIIFTNCSWKENKALYSPAVDISPSNFDHLSTGLLPIPVFKNCYFTRNMIVPESKNRSKLVGAGVFVITRFVVIFEGIFRMDNNQYSALLVNSGKIIINPNSRLTFKNNVGLRGGAISLFIFSSILVSDNCTLEFYENIATEYGGAIYQYSTEIREFVAGRSCFLEYNGRLETPISERNISFIFTGNVASISGSSIFASSFYACYFRNRGTLGRHNVAEFLNDIGNFTFDSFNPTNSVGETIAPALGTTESIILSSEDNLLSIPGKRLYLPLSVKDELKQHRQTEFFVQIVQNKNTIHVKVPYTINNSIEVYGFPHQSAYLIATTHNAHRILQYALVIELLTCPPGYYFDTLALSCECSSTNKYQAFLGIVKCNSENFTAAIQSGYWAGHYHGHDTLYTAFCPYKFCIDRERKYFLPVSSANLSSFVCMATREGVLCGECRRGHSSYYHSRTLTCGKSDRCSYGIPLYIVAEILPVLILFTLIVIFDISFTTGGRNGFVFFSQMVTILQQDLTRHGWEVAQYFQSGYNLFYRIFNIDFFSLEQLSFCLFEGATAMDVLAFKYITIVFAFILIITVVVCANYCTRCSKPCSAMKKVTARKSLLHGLSAFIVICYTESVRVSFFILRYTTLRRAGGQKGPSVAFYAGIAYLDKKHLSYAIPAIVSLGTIAIIPPFLLLVYPSFLKVLHLCKVSEHRFVTAMLRVTRINSLMPMFDVFQGCFKDNVRFFAGLYFFYRVAILVPYSFTVSFFQYALVAEFSLLAMLGFHSIVQPYKLRIHNIIDSLLFLDLAVINGLTIVLLKYSDSDSTEFLLFIVYSQVLLIYIPFMVLLFTCIGKLIKAVQNKHSKEVSEDRSEQEFLEHLDGIDRNADNSVEMNGIHLRSNYARV